MLLIKHGREVFPTSHTREGIGVQRHASSHRPSAPEAPSPNYFSWSTAFALWSSASCLLPQAFRPPRPPPLFTSADPQHLHYFFCLFELFLWIIWITFLFIVTIFLFISTILCQFELFFSHFNYFLFIFNYFFFAIFICNIFYSFELVFVIWTISFELFFFI